MSRQVVVDIVGDSSKFSKSLDTATTKTGGFKSVLSGLGTGIGLGIFDTITGSIGNVVSALGDADKAFKDDQQSQALLGQALKNNVPNFDGNTTSIENLLSANERLGFSDDEQRQALGKLVGTTHDVNEAQTIMAAAMDLSRLKGIDLATATDALIKAHQGNFKALKDVGVQTDKNSTFTQVLGQVQTIAAGQAEAYANTSNGKVAASQLKVGEAMEKLGGIVDKVSTVALPILADAFSNVIDWVTQTYDQLKPLIDQIAANLGPAIDKLGKIITQVFTDAQPLINGATIVFKAAFDLTIAAIGFLVEAISTIWTTANTVVTDVTTAFNGIVGFFQGLPGQISSAVGGMWDGIWTGFKTVINDIIRGWNSLQFAVPAVDLGPLGKVGGFTLGVPQIPYLHQGGVVPGPRGADVLAVLQAGETVVPMNASQRGQAGTVNLTVNVNGAGDTGAVSNKVLREIKRELGRQGMNFA